MCLMFYMKWIGLHIFGRYFSSVAISAACIQWVEYQLLNFVTIKLWIILDILKQQLTLDEYDRMIKKVRAGCQTKFPVDDSVFDELAANRFPTDPNLMVSCKWLTSIQLNWIGTDAFFCFLLRKVLCKLCPPRHWLHSKWKLQCWVGIKDGQNVCADGISRRMVERFWSLSRH